MKFLPQASSWGGDHSRRGNGGGVETPAPVTHTSFAGPPPHRGAMGRNSSVSFRVTIACTRAQGEAIGAMDDLPGFGDHPPVLVADEPDAAKPDEWLIHAYFDHQPSDDELALLTGLGNGRPAGRATRRGRLGDDEPGRAAADPRRPLLRPHADPHARSRTGSISRSTPASPSAPASMRPPPAASPRSTARARRREASPMSPTSAPAPACSPSPRSLCGPRRNASRPTSTRSRSTSPATMRRSTASGSATARASCCSRSPTAWTRRCSPPARRST